MVAYGIRVLTDTGGQLVRAAAQPFKSAAGRFRRREAAEARRSKFKGNSQMQPHTACGPDPDVLYLALIHPGFYQHWRHGMHAAQRGESGFTLAEMLVILAIIGVLAAVLVPSVTNQITKSQTARVANDLTVIHTAVEAFVSDVARYPGDLEDLSVAITITDGPVTGVAIRGLDLTTFNLIDEVVDNGRIIR